MTQTSALSGYFDNAASAPVHPFAAELFTQYLREYSANQEAAGYEGRRSAEAVERAGKKLAALLLPGGETFFCNTGTDALNAGICAHFMTHPGTAAVTAEGEHPALLKALDRYAGKVYRCPLRKDGSPDPEQLKTLLAEKVSLFAVHHVNSETGHIADVPFFNSILNHERTVFLLDTIQSAGKIPVPEGPDMVTLSGCKTGAPCGGALLYRGRGAFANSLKALRSSEHRTGRCIPAAALTLADAMEYDLQHLAERKKHAFMLKQRVIEHLRGFSYTETCPDSTPYLLHLLFRGIQGAVLVRILSAKGITAASGSACASETPEPSPVLRAMGYSKKEAYSALRLSFWDNLTMADADFLGKELAAGLKNY